MRGRYRILDLAGEGALAGWISGCALGAWQVILNADLPHRMLLLAAIRLSAPALAGACFGIALSFVLAGLFRGLRSLGRRAVLTGILLLALLSIYAVWLAAWPMRGRLFPLYLFGSRKLAVGIFLLVVGPGLALLAARSRDAWRSRPLPAGIGPARRGAARAGLALGAAALVTYLACPLLGRVRSRGMPSVILVSLDTMRADRLGALGNPRPLTPRLDALAAEGVLFEQAEAAAPWTLPSHASLFSSQLPFDHGLRWDHDFAPLASVFPAEHFREAGYRCAAFTGDGYVSGYYGFSQGFEIYRESDELKEGGPEGIAGAALDWVRENESSPFFLFVHTYEAHLPYLHAEFAAPDSGGRIGPSLSNEQVDAIHDGKLRLTEGERARVRDLYDSDVAWADRVIGGMLQTLKEEGVLEHTILVVLSDHGQDLWDHNATWSPGHGHNLYEEVLRVVLFLRAPGLIPPGLRIHSPVSLMDVAPTLLSLAGLPPDPGYRGQDLAPSCRSGTEPPPEMIQAESMEFGPERFCVRDGNLKLILTPRPDRQLSGSVTITPRPIELFDLGSDPGERVDLSRFLGGPVRTLMHFAWQRADKALFSGRSTPPNPEDLPPELLEKLRSLGYVQ